MPLSEDELVTIIDAHRNNSLGDESTDLANERARAMDHYHGRPYGDEQKGRSQVVSKDLADTVGWIMPAIMKAYTQSGNLVDFIATSEEDEESAQQEADYINHVIMKDNNGWINLHDWVKDALLLKNGYIKHWWDESETIRESEYSGLTEMGVAKLFQELQREGSEIEILEQDSEMVPMDDSGIEVEVFSLKLRVTTKKGRVRIEAIPTEEIRISKKARNGTQDSQFIEHFTTKTRTELIEMGMDADWINNRPASSSNGSEDSQTTSRDSTTDETDTTVDTADRSMDELDYGEAYIQVDYDGDGKAELRKVITVANKIPPGDEWNEVVDCVAITSMTTKRVPHRHIGESLDDDLADLQQIKTVLTRQLMDNVYGSNNQQYVINELANIPDFLQSLPNGLKRLKTDQPVTGHVMPLPVSPIINQILPAIDYIDQMKDGRTGVNQLSTNVDPDVLKDTTKGAFMEGVSRASQKVEMILRMTAETGVKELALRVHELLIKNQDIPRMIKLRGKYAEVNPTEWRERTDMTVRVGLGTGTEEEKRQKLSLVNSLQLGLRDVGLIGPEEAYNLFDETLSTINIENAERYAMNPLGDKYKQVQQELAQQQQPNPLAEAEQVKGQMQLQIDQVRGQMKMASEQQKLQFEAQMEQLKRDYEAQLAIVKLQNDNDEKESERLMKEGIAMLQAEIELIKAGSRQDLGQPGIGAEVATDLMEEEIG